MSVWLRPTPSSSSFLWVWVLVVACCPLGLLAATTVVESTDPAIAYTGVWERVQQNSTTAYAVSNTTGSKAVYTFAGTAISVFGVVLPRDAPGAAQVSEYSVDGGPAARYTAPGDVAGAIYGVRFFAAAGLASQGQHTLAIVNLGDEFVLAHFEVTPNPSRVGPSASDPGPGPSLVTTTTATATSSGSSALPSSSALAYAPSTTQSASSQSTSASNSNSNGTLTATDTAALPPTPAPTFATSSPSVPASSSSSGIPPNDGLAQGRTSTALSRGATIGGGIAGISGFLLLVGGLCWYGQRRGRRRHKHRGSSRVSTSSKAPLGMTHTGATSQVTLGSDPFASDAAAGLRRGPPLYVPVGSASDLSAGVGGEGGGTQYTPTPAQGPGRAGYGYGYGYGYGCQNEKYEYGTDDTPLQSPTSPLSNSASDPNLLGGPTDHAHTFASPPPPVETPEQVRGGMDADGRRRSADGGVRIAGGPPGQRAVRHDRDESFLDLASRRSVGSTLPPAYYFEGD